jgi:hypothetical protein
MLIPLLIIFAAVMPLLVLLGFMIHDGMTRVKHGHELDERLQARFRHPTTGPH